MADFNAIAAVSRTLRRLLVDRIETPSVTVTLAPPDVTVANINGPRINLYCFQADQQPSLQNQHPPGREHPAAFGHPPLSLTLRYLMTSYARSEDQPDSDLIAQALLGDAMLVMHDFGGRMDDMLLVTNRIGAIGDPVLDAVLQQEFERVKIVQARTPMDDLSKLWSAMPETNFRRGIIYEASVVQIEGRRPRRQSQPVEMRRLTVSVSQPPRILEAYRTPPPAPADTLRSPRVGVGEEITIEHAALVADRLYIRFGGLEPIRVPQPTNGRIRILVPDDQYPIDLDHPAVRPIPPERRLQPGALEVVLLSVNEVDGVEGALDRGTPFTDERALRSNTALMQLVPVVTASTPASGDATDILVIDGERLWAERLPSEVIIGDAAIPVRPPQPGDPWAAPTPIRVEVPVSAIAAIFDPGPTLYPVAVQVNGVRSAVSGLTFRLDP